MEENQKHQRYHQEGNDNVILSIQTNSCIQWYDTLEDKVIYNNSLIRKQQKMDFNDI